MTMNALVTGLILATTTLAQPSTPLDLEFDDGVDGWRVVVDGVMGGRSSGRVGTSSPGVLLFSGDLSLENNGGFSQIRANVPQGSFVDADGVEIRVRGDGRQYTFDIRCSDVRMMAGGFQRVFQTKPGEWMTMRLPFDSFALYSFGRRVSDAPVLIASNIESVGVTLADKKEGPFRLEIDSIRAFGESVPTTARSGTDLSSVARGAGLDTLLELLSASGLELPTGERVTILAPTDEAFAALPEATVRELLTPEGLEALRSILSFHVVSGGMSSSDLLARRSIETLNGQRLDIGSAGPLSIGGAGLVTVDVPFDAGVVHVIDRVLMPELASIVELASTSDDLGTLVAAVGAAGLAEQLDSENGPWTVFAPVDSAFEALPAGVLDDLLRPENRSSLARVLGLHVVPGRLYAGELLTARRARTLFGDSIEFGIEEGRLRVGDGFIVGADIEASNGVVHLIDGVLLPAAPEAVSARRSAEAARLCELAIERGVPLFNAGQHGACASIYEITIDAMVSLGGRDLGREVVDRLELGLAEGAAEQSWAERAWTYRRALDDVYPILARRVEATTTNALR